MIHHLKDGRRKYSTHHGEIEKWERSDIEAMERCREFYGNSAFLADFSRYGVVAKELRERFPNAKIIPVVGFETEDHDLPLRTDIIF
ncbi:hypothetical protein KML24007_04270 [Alistipes indistinctus]